MSLKAYDFSNLDTVLSAAVENGTAPAISVEIGMGNEVLYRQAYGKITCEENAPQCNEQTRFDLASITKCIAVGTLVFQAVDAGVLDLQDTLNLYFDAPKEKSDITIRQLVTHTAGFSTGLHLWEAGTPPEECVKTVLQAPLAYEPGTRELYCCAGFILLGKLLERLYGQSLDELTKERVLIPLKTASMGYCPSGENIAATERQADGTLLCGTVHDENARFLNGISGNAGLFGTAADVGTYVRMLAGKGCIEHGTRLFSRAVFREACQNNTPGMTQHRGLAFYLPRHSDGYAGELFPEGSIGHTGFTGTSFTLDVQSGLYFVLLANRICPDRRNGAMNRLRRVAHNAVYSIVDP